MAPHADSPEAAPHVAALWAARRTVMAAQTGAGDLDLPAQLDRAENRGWPDVVRVLLYADVLRAEASIGESELPPVERLRERAERDGDLVTLAAALGLRAWYRYDDGPAAQEQSEDDLARGTALLDDARDGALTRSCAYVCCAMAYAQRELWELAEELYAAASEASAADGPHPVHSAVLLGNRAEALVTLACALREAGDLEGAQELYAKGMAAAAAAVRAAVQPDFGTEARVGRHLLAAVVGRPTTDTAAALEEDVARPAVAHPQLLRGRLRLADALRAADGGDLTSAGEQAERALALLVDDRSAPWYALALRVAAEARATLEPRAAELALRYAEDVARRRWESRTRLLGAARARLTAERLRAERDLQTSYAHLDELTGLANRRGYARAVEALQRGGGSRRLAVLVVDVDHFKSVNDTHGHPVGDDVLRTVARALRRGTRTTDLTARMGGDEFAVVLHDVEVEAAHERALEIVAGVADEPWDALSPGLRVTVSVGVAGAVDHDLERLFGRADEALYIAKAAGGNRCDSVEPSVA